MTESADTATDIFPCARFIKEIGRGPHGARALCAEDTHTLYSAMLDGRVSDLELGAVLLAEFSRHFAPRLGFGDRQFDLDQLVILQRALELQVHALGKPLFGHGNHGVELVADGAQLFFAGGI